MNVKVIGKTNFCQEKRVSLRFLYLTNRDVKCHELQEAQIPRGGASCKKLRQNSKLQPTSNNHPVLVTNISNQY